MSLIDASTIQRIRQTLSTWKTEGRPWMGYLLLGAILLFLLSGLCLVVAGLIVLSVVSGRGNSDASKGIPAAILWLLAVLSVVGIGLFYFWWQFFRGEGPRGGPADLRAAHAGVAEAMVDLALDLREGRGGPKDLVLARGWLLRAQAAGSPCAKNYLAEVETQLGDRHSDLGF